jgi:hypothetical protein
MDLLSEQDTNQFLSVMQDICDTFIKYPVILRRSSGDIPLLAGVQNGRVKSESDVDGEMNVEEAGRDEVDELKTLRFSKKVLDDMGVTFTYDDVIVLEGHTYSVLTIQKTAYFREDRMIVILEIGR